jgi:hypothetical protein
MRPLRLKDDSEAAHGMRYNTGEEATHYFFEIAKHFTTLDTAAILIYLAMSNQFSDPHCGGRSGFSWSPPSARRLACWPRG